MFCTNCGTNLPDDVKFCPNCGASPQNTASQSSIAQPAATPPRKKRHTGLIIFLVIILAFAGVILYLVGSFAWLPPRNLGVRYTQSDFDSAMSKIGLQVNFEGMSSAELTELIAENREERIPIDQFNWHFSNYEERKFELTQEELTAFINEVAPPLSWFQNVQIKIMDDGRIASSYRVRFDKIKDELIPDAWQDIPPQIARFLPDTFNLYMEGEFEIEENEILVPEKLDSLNIGSVPMKPIIEGVFGKLSDDDRDYAFEYVERIYEMVPNLVFHELSVNHKGNIDVSIYMPTLVTITRK